MTESNSLVTELENALNSSSSEKRLATLRRVTGLFLDEAERLNEQQTAVFDDVLVHLTERIELQARIALSAKLAPLTNAPTEIVRRLANDDAIAVASPVLTQSSRLTESDLIEIAKSKGQGQISVCSRLLTFASLGQRDQIHKAIMGISDQVIQEASKPRDFSASERLIRKLNRADQLNEKALSDFATGQKYEEMTAALALLCDAPTEFIDELMRNPHAFGLVIACKAVKISWPTVLKILHARFSHHSNLEQELDEARTTYFALSQASAQKTLQFMLYQKSKPQIYRFN